MNLEGGKGQGKAKGKGTKGNARGRAKGKAMGKARGKIKTATKGKAQAKAQSKGKGQGLQDEDYGGDESDSHPHADNILDIEDFTDMGKGKGTIKGTANGALHLISSGGFSFQQQLIDGTFSESEFFS